MSTQGLEDPSDTVAGILAEFGALGIRLSVDDRRLKVNARKGALNDRQKTAIASHRDEIIARLHGDRSPRFRGPETSSCCEKPTASSNGRAAALLVPGQDRPGP